MNNKNETIESIHGELPQLQEADIVLIRTKKGLLRKLLRTVTNSYWDHSAFVFHPKDPKKGSYYNLLVEAVEPNGIEIHKLDKYINHPEKYDIGIKRVPKLSPQIKERIVTFMLLNVDAPYYRLKLRRFLLAVISKKYSEKLLGRQRYSCSGFVQKAFYEAASWEERERFIFADDLLSPIELQETITPGDLGESSKSIWIYNEQ